METSPEYRYVRGLGPSASLYAVTPRGIEDFLAAAEASQPGVVVLANEDDGRSRILGALRVGEVLRYIGGLDHDVIGLARPLAVLTVDAGPGERAVGVDLARRLRDRAEAARSRAALAPGDGLGRYESLAEEAPRAIAHVLGLDPFEPGPALN